MMLTIAALLLATASPTPAANAAISAFQETCLPSRSLSELTDSLTNTGWKEFSSPSDSRLAVPMMQFKRAMDAQSLSPEVKLYGHDQDGVHLEILVAKRPPGPTERAPDIGCRLYDFAATTPIPIEQLNALAGGAQGQIGSLAGGQTGTWYRVLGTTTTMRTTFVPSSSEVGAQLGFSGMILGTNFPDGAQ
jgi:hypothetical protein